MRCLSEVLSAYRMSLVNYESYSVVIIALRPQRPKVSAILRHCKTARGPCAESRGAGRGKPNRILPLTWVSGGTSFMEGRGAQTNLDPRF